MTQETGRRVARDRVRTRGALLLLAVMLLALHFVHLRADPGPGAAWHDAARFTDEGWYGDAAIRWATTGQWRVPGDLNTAAVMPVWPVLEAAAFAVFGMQVVVARALGVCCLLAVCACAHGLLRQLAGRRSLAPETAVLLLAASSFVFTFSRLAVLECPMLLMILLCLLLAGYAARGRGWLLALGVAIPLMVLTKSTAIVALPAILWRVWTVLRGSDVRSSLHRLPRAALWLATPAAAVTLGYVIWVWRAGLGVDIATYFAPLHNRVTHRTVLPVFVAMLGDARWLGVVFGSLGALAMLWSLRRLRHDALTQCLWLLATAYTLFILYHANLQPRYLLVIAGVLALSMARELGSLIEQGGAASFSGIAVLALLVLVEGGRIGGWVVHPRYTWWNTAQAIRQRIDTDGGHSRLLQGSSAAEIGLMTGLPHLAVVLTASPTPALAQRYGTGWFVAWRSGQALSDERYVVDSMRPYFRMTEVERFDVMDDPDRHILVLYRVDAIPGTPPAPSISR